MRMIPRQLAPRAGSPAEAFAPRLLRAEYSGQTVTGAGDLTLFSLQLPARALGTKRGLRFSWLLARTTGSGNVTLKARWGGVRFDASGALAGPAYWITGELWAAGSLTSQRGVLHARSIAASTDISHFGQSTAFSANTANPTVLDLLVALNTSADVVTLHAATVELL